MNIFIRVDIGKVIGDGHLYRCKALASKFLTYGYKPIFVTRPGEGFVEEKFHPFEVLTLSAKKRSLEQSSTYSDWLELQPEEDAAECLKLIGQSKRDLWITDHYGIGNEWEEYLLNNDQFIVAVDDIFRPHSAQVIIDHNFTAKKEAYLNSHPEAKFLMGPRYALLRDDICKAPNYSFHGKDSYLLFLGAVEKDLFMNYLNVLRTLNLSRLVLLGPPAGIELKNNETIMEFCSDIPSLYNQQKLIFGSCGVANMERMALGVPTISCSVASNQEKVGEKIKELGIAYHIGDLRFLSAAQIQSEVAKVIKNPQLLNNIISKAQSAVAKDGTFEIAREVHSYFKEWKLR